MVLNGCPQLEDLPRRHKKKVTSRRDVLMVSMQGFFLRLQTEDKTGMLGLALESSFLRALLLTAVSECRVGSLSCAHSPALPGGATLAWLFSAELLKCSGCSAPVPKARSEQRRLEAAM